MDLQHLYPVHLRPSQSAPALEPTSIYDEVKWGEGPADRPYVAINMVTTVDGKVTLDHNRFREPIGSRADRTLMMRLRDGVDAVMRGAATVRAYPYYPKASPGASSKLKARGLAEHPLAVVVTTSCDLPLDSPFFQEAPRRPLVLTSTAAPADAVAMAREVADVELIDHDVEEGQGGSLRAGVDLTVALRRLRTRYGIRRLLLEGGPRVNYECFRRHLVDELFWTVAPKVAGKRDDLTMVEGDELLLPLRRLRLVSVYAHGEELFVRYRVENGAAVAGDREAVVEVGEAVVEDSEAVADGEAAAERNV